MNDKTELLILFNIFRLMSDTNEHSQSGKLSMMFVNAYATYAQAINWIQNEGLFNEQYIIYEVVERRKEA